MPTPDEQARYDHWDRVQALAKEHEADIKAALQRVNEYAAYWYTLGTKKQGKIPEPPPLTSAEWATAVLMLALNANHPDAETWVNGWFSADGLRYVLAQAKLSPRK